MERVKLNLLMNIKEVLLAMGEGNPGAIDVCCRLLMTSPEGLITLFDLDELNMRGPQIWVAYKDYANENLEVFADAVRTRNPKMVEVVNRECGGEHQARTFKR